ncbi:MAG: DUF4097 family beta strand repeat protein [Solobacterium sp.]|nr:DUF4097 family beta strand repeat protein [Solobacterium sp.]
MRKEEYFAELEKKLTGYDVEMQQEILEEFHAHFNEAVQNGKSEEEVLADLGSPDELYDNIRTIYGDPAPRTSSSDAFPFDIDQFSSVLKGAFNTIGEIVSITVDSAVQSYKEQENASQMRSEATAVDCVGCDTLRIRSWNCDLDVYISRGEKLEYTFRPVNSLFSKKPASLNVDVTDRKVDFVGELGRGKLIVKVPDAFRILQMDLTSGDTEVIGLHLDEMDMRTTSGDLSLRSCAIGTLRVSVTSGDISCRDCTGDVYLKATSGDISMFAHAGETIMISTTSGDIDVQARGEHISLSAGSGDIQCDRPDSEYSVDITTRSGDVVNYTGETMTRIEKGIYFISGGTKRIRVQTTSGDVTIV